MFRDKTSLTNIGYGLTSRDIPTSSTEEKRANPNSGAIARALDDKPVVKFVSTMAATLAASYATSKLFAKGGLKLAKTIQRSADSGSQLGRRFVETAGQIRKTLDELEGINRYVDDGVDPYARLVYENADRGVIKPQLTRLVGPEYVSDGSMWMTRSEFQAIAAGRQPVAEWAYKDQLQSNLVRHTRSLGLMLPSTYVVQRGLTDPLFGNSDDKPKVNWYNPVDVITDFVKQSTINITTFIGPQAAAGASIKRLRQLSSAPYQDFPLPFSRNQLKTANKVADIKTVLMAFGQDAEKLLNQANRISSSAAYAFNTSFQEAQRQESGVVHALHQARRGAKAARAASEASSEGKLAAAAKSARAYLFGYSNKTGSEIILGTTTGGARNAFGIDEATKGFVDTIPALRGITVRS